MKQIFNESHLETLNQMLRNEILEIIESSEKKVQMTKDKKSSYSNSCPTIINIASEVSGKPAEDLFIEIVSSLDSKVLFFDICFKKGRMRFQCISKEKGSRSLTQRYWYFPESSSVRNRQGTRIVRGVPYKDAKQVYRVLDSILDRNESIDCTYTQFVEIANRYLISRK